MPGAWPQPGRCGADDLLRRKVDDTTHAAVDDLLRRLRRPRPAGSGAIPAEPAGRSAGAEADGVRGAAPAGSGWVAADPAYRLPSRRLAGPRAGRDHRDRELRSEEHTSELQSLRHLVCRP